MEAHGTPCNRRGGRNLECPFYDDCLDFVVEQGWRVWMCAECPHRNTKKEMEVPMVWETVVYDLSSFAVEVEKTPGDDDLESWMERTESMESAQTAVFGVSDY